MNQSNFVPLTTVQGMHPLELIEKIGQRRLVVWGCGHLGRCLARIFRSFGVAPLFCDRQTDIIGTNIDGSLVQSIGTTIDSAAMQQSFIVIAVAGAVPQILARGIKAGLTVGEDILSFRKLARPEAEFQINGIGDEELVSRERFTQAVDKLMKDVPHLLQITLNGKRDPLLHPDIDALVSFTRERVSCSVTTHLNEIEDSAIGACLQARPHLLVVKAAGLGRNRLAEFQKKLKSVARKRANTSPATELRVSYERKRSDDPLNLEAVRSTCENAGITLVVSESYIEPYDLVLDYCEAHPPRVSTLRCIKELRWDLDTALNFSKRDAHHPCLCQRIFPVLRHDLSVAVCHLYDKPQVAADFLTEEYGGLLQHRHMVEHCRNCQKHALHRLDFDVLQLRHNDFKTMGRARTGE